MAASFDHAEDVFTQSGYIRDGAFRDEALTALVKSIEFARRTRWDSIRSPHIFMGLLDSGDDGIADWCDRLGADVPRLIEQFEELFQHETGSGQNTIKLHREFISDNVIRLLREAVQRAVDHQRTEATAMDLLVILFTTPNSIVAECFERIGVTAARLTELAVLAEQAATRSV